MKPDIWQEIDKLRKRISDLEKKQTAQRAILAKPPQFRVGEIIHSKTTGSIREYALQGRNIDDTTDECYTQVTTMPHDPGPPATKQPFVFWVDTDGKRYILPDPHRTILVQDQGAGNGKHVEKDKNGTVTTPPGSTSYPMVVSEPTSSFHSSSYPWKSGRIYPGQKMVDVNDNHFYLVYVEGHGDEDENHDIVIGATTLRIITDYAGKFVDVTTV